MFNVGCSLTFLLQAAHAREVETQQQHARELQKELSHATTETEAARRRLSDASSLQSDAEVNVISLRYQAKGSSTDYTEHISYQTSMRHAQAYDFEAPNQTCEMLRLVTSVVPVSMVSTGD